MKNYEFKTVQKPIFNHVSSTGHSVDWAGAKLIYNSDNTYNRLVVESSLIKHLPNFNSSTGLCAIDNFSKNLILNSNSNISNYLSSLQPPTGRRSLP